MEEEQYLDVVDKEDKVIGKELRSKKIELGFISRNTVILVKDADDKYIICKRSMLKKSCPGLFDFGACGNVDHGESYEDAAKREVQEELGISCDLKFLKKIYNEFTDNTGVRKYFTGLFLGKSNQPIKLNHEVTEYKKFTLEELKSLLHESPEKFSPSMLFELKEVEHLLT